MLPTSIIRSYTFRACSQLKPLVLLGFLLIAFSLPVCAPQAEVKASVTSGQAPLSVSFTNTSKNTDEFHWDFGDGATMTTSTKEEPVTHKYTKAGMHTVTLTAIKKAEPTKTSTMTLTISVLHGPLDRVKLRPEEVALTVGQSQKLTAEAVDAYDNPIPEARLTWEVAEGAGIVTSDGMFTVGTKVGIFRDGIVVIAKLNTHSAKGTASVTVKPDPSRLVTGVHSIYAVGVPGPLLALNSAAVPVVAGDDDTIPFRARVVMASGLGSGRVVAFSLSGFLINETLELFDNKQFGNNVVDWLDGLSRRKILITTGHREWYGGSNFDSFKAELERRGYTVTRFSGPIVASRLSDVGVVLIGTAWGNVSSSEIDALTNFVTNGGGLLLTGLGWSWEPYNPGFTLDDYPMNRIARPYGIRWIDGYISDPSDNYEKQPVFHTFYPNIEF